MASLDYDTRSQDAEVKMVNEEEIHDIALIRCTSMKNKDVTYDQGHCEIMKLYLYDWGILKAASVFAQIS